MKICYVQKKHLQSSSKQHFPGEEANCSFKNLVDYETLAFMCFSGVRVEDLRNTVHQSDTHPMIHAEMCGDTFHWGAVACWQGAGEARAPEKSF